MELSYYPGCSLHGTSAEYDESIRAVFGALGVGLSELDDWTCCGASSAHVTNEKLAHLLSSRNLMIARHAGRDLMVPCAACYSRLKFAEKEEPSATGGEFKVWHIHDLLAGDAVREAIEAKVVRPLTGLRAIPYYGCLTVRPPKVTGSPHPENPVALDEVLEAIGATVARWPFKTDCCGGSFTLSRPDVVAKLSGDLVEAARHAGGDCIVTDCPMCQSNLDTRQDEIAKERGWASKMPVFFITELVGHAIGATEAKRWLNKHLVDPGPVLQERGLL